MNLSALGINFQSAPIALREKVALRPDQIGATLQRMAGKLPGAELALVSTCNRTELYVAGVAVEARKAFLLELLTAGESAQDRDELEPHFYFKSGFEAANHLIAVACSLDSMVVGENEILGQVKQAYAFAMQEQTIGTTLSPVFQTAFRTAKRVFSETDICRGRVSVSSIAVEFTEMVFDTLADKTVMVVGAGETAELALKSLIDKGVKHIVIANRSFHHGKALADKYAGETIPFEQLADHLPRADIVVSSTAAPHCVIHTDAVHRAIKARRGQPMLLIDIAVPRDIEAGVADVENVYLYHIDDLQKAADANLARRREAVEQAWRIVTEECDTFASSSSVDGFRALMRQLDDHAQQVVETALKRTLAKQKMTAIPDSCREEITEMAKKIASSLLAKPRVALRDASRNGQWTEVAKVTSTLFGFEKEQDVNKEKDK